LLLELSYIETLIAWRGVGVGVIVLGAVLISSFTSHVVKLLAFYLCGSVWGKRTLSFSRDAARIRINRRAHLAISRLRNGRVKCSSTFEGAARPGAFTVLVDRAFSVPRLAARIWINRGAHFAVSGLRSGHGKRSITCARAVRPGAYTILVGSALFLSGFTDWSYRRALFTVSGLWSGHDKSSSTCA